MTKAKRYLSLFFPRLSTDRLARARQEPLRGAVALTHNVNGRMVLAALNKGAEAQGLRPAMPLATAHAICPGLQIHEADPAADARLLQQLAGWAGQFSPHVAIEGTDGLMLDVSGCAHLFDGEDALASQVIRQLRARGMALRLGLADTPGAAWAIARYGQGHPILPPGGQKAALAELPVAALRLPPATVEDLQRMGLGVIGALYPMPRAGLAARYGMELAMQLDRALGDSPEPITPQQHRDPYSERLAFADPIGLGEDITLALRELLQRLSRRLEDDALGGRRFRLTCCLADGTAQQIEIGTARPERAPERLFRLFEEKLQTLDPGFGIDVMILQSPVVDPYAADQSPMDLRRAEELATGELAPLVDRLANRLGSDAVGRVAPRHSHLPDRAQDWVPGLPGRINRQWPKVPPRPAQLLRRPAPLGEVTPSSDGDVPVSFTYHRRRHELRKITGPERISPDWWRPDPSWNRRARDYYRVEDTDGQRFWIYRESDAGRASTAGDSDRQWYLHGVFA